MTRSENLPSRPEFYCSVRGGIEDEVTSLLAGDNPNECCLGQCIITSSYPKDYRNSNTNLQGASHCQQALHSDKRFVYVQDDMEFEIVELRHYTQP